MTNQNIEIFYDRKRTLRAKHAATLILKLQANISSDILVFSTYIDSSKQRVRKMRPRDNYEKSTPSVIARILLGI